MPMPYMDPTITRSMSPCILHPRLPTQICKYIGRIIEGWGWAGTKSLLMEHVMGMLYLFQEKKFKQGR